MQALKEWSAAVHALLAGRQMLLLRKGGIHEKRFAVPDAGGTAPFLMFPTVSHAHAARVRPEHQGLLADGVADVADEVIVVRAAAWLVTAIEVRRPDRIEALEPWHIWTSESVRADRLDFRPRHLLAALVVEARPVAEPVRVPRLPKYAGCRSWVELPPLGDLGAPVVPREELLEVADRVRALVG
jgi:hypothetical protein